MFWEEDEDKALPYQVPDDVVDLAFKIQCKSLPVNHAWALSQAILEHLPWITDTKGAGIHQIHVAESNNGWIRPGDDEEDAVLYPSKRTKMMLRIPTHRLSEAESLNGTVLDINGHELTIGKAKKHSFTNASVIFARYVLSETNDTAETTNEDENTFLQRIANEIKVNTGFKVKKLLCGKSHRIKTTDTTLETRHLMIADLDSDTSIYIQQFGLGGGRELGCGLFLPHKGIKSLNSTE